MNDTPGVVFSRPVPGEVGAHALIVGIDDYPHLAASPLGDLPRLTSAAISAIAFYDWLVNRARLAVPLATCRLLLSPAPGSNPDLAPARAAPATTDEFLKAAWGWRSAANTSTEGMAIFFFCGHRLQVSREEDIFLFQNFGEPFGPTFRGAVSFVNLFNGMEAHENPIAQTQLYLLDGSRHPFTRSSLGERLYGMTDVFDVLLSGPDRRAAGVFNAAARGEQAWTLPGEPSLFTRAVIEGLEGAAAVAQDSPGTRAVDWAVTIGSLSRWMARENQRLATEYNVPTTFRVNIIGDGVVARIDDAPTVPLDVCIEPAAEAGKGIDLIVEDEKDNVVRLISDPGPRLRIDLPAGIYALTVVKRETRARLRQLIVVAPESADAPIVLTIPP